ncbi:VOC family protein [Micromonospora sp. NPDC049679]|uniref:VOC family protein n=1 Tax=Micromonospora sp. NPDC049679 TaxID=3155920 RepID=UPI0034059CBA
MANGRRPVATVRKLIAAVLGTVATFVMLFGAGMTSWAIVALGVALLVLAVSLVLVTALRGGARAWVAGTAHVRSVSEPPAASAYGRCELQILIDAPGLPPRSVKVRDPRVPVAKWPDPGATLPIMVAIDDQRHVRILWDDVLTHAEAATTDDGAPPLYDDGDRDPLVNDILIDDQLLVGDEVPPWVRRGTDDDLLPPERGEPVTADLTDDLIGLRDDRVVVHQPPGGGPIVLEGTLVDPPSSVPLPRRAKPSPRPRPDEPDPTPGPVVGGAGPAAAATETPAARAESAAPAAGTVLIDPPPDAAATGPVASGARPTAAWQDEPAGGLHDPVEEEAVLGGLGAPEPGVQPGATGPIHGVGITVLVADLDRSVAFYRDMLGFFEIDGGDGNAVLASGATRLVLRAIRDVAPINRRLVHLNLEVDDVGAVYQELKTKGVRFTYAPRAVNRGAKLELWAAAFRDPDGHGIAITQWRERSAD